MGEAAETGSAEAHENEGAMDAGEAARLLAQTQRHAQRDLDYRSPLLSLVAAVVVLVAFGAVWLTVRGQHPYKGPTAASLVVLYTLIAIRIATVIYAQSRAGASGRSVRLRKAEGAAAAAALLAVYVWRYW
jgi:hypothetical protein